MPECKRALEVSPMPPGCDDVLLLALRTDGWAWVLGRPADEARPLCAFLRTDPATGDLLSSLRSPPAAVGGWSRSVRARLVSGPGPEADVTCVAATVDADVAIVMVRGDRRDERAVPDPGRRGLSAA